LNLSLKSLCIEQIVDALLVVMQEKDVEAGAADEVQGDFRSGIQGSGFRVQGSVHRDPLTRTPHLFLL
jgi:hypothetical protein